MNSIQARKVMSINTISVAICGVILLHSTSASASVVLYTDKSLFDAATNTALINFDTIDSVVVGDNDLLVDSAHVIDDIVFTTDIPETRNAWICGKDRCSDHVNANPRTYVLDSALFVAAGSFTNPADIVVDLSISPVTAVGGLFGDIDGPDNTSPVDLSRSGTFNVYDNNGVITSFDVTFGEMATGPLNKTFFGWTATESVITKIEFVTDEPYSGLDDFQYGTVVPVPAAAWLFASGLLGLIGFARRRK
jgi:hypothetical protein